MRNPRQSCFKKYKDIQATCHRLQSDSKILEACSVTVHCPPNYMGEKDLNVAIYLFNQKASQPKEDLKTWTNFTCWGFAVKCHASDNLERKQNSNYQSFC